MSKQDAVNACRFAMVICLAIGVMVGYHLGKDSETKPCPPTILESRLLGMTVVGDDMRERVKDTGMENTIVVVSLHLYDDHDELNLDYQTHSDQAEEEVWGWSNCEWQPEQNAAFCDIYSVRPKFVHADMAMDTLGHELWHGVTGDFHPDD